MRVDRWPDDLALRWSTSVALKIFSPENAISTARDRWQASPLFVKGFPK